ncbi:Rv3235 family protein [Nocardioides sp.]|uniref:Rv3235 family protein n=1 Tax=Nocardioides sp. TaxID=35761 RepID=UPI002ED1C983
MSEKSSYLRVVPLRQPVPVATVQGTLALDLEGASEPYEPPLSAVPDPTRPGCHELESWAPRFAQAAVEIAGGDRPVSQLLRWTSPEVYEDLGRRAQVVRSAVLRDSTSARVQQVRPLVESAHTCWLDERVAEVSVRVRYGRRSRALAIRFEQRSGRWVAVAMEFA